MFQLVAIVIAVILAVAVLAGTAIYGSAAASAGKADAEALKLLDQATQIQSAAALYEINEQRPAGFSSGDWQSDLAGTYMRTVPTGWSTAPCTADPTKVCLYIQTDDVSVCSKVNKKMGLAESVPSCASLTPGDSACCVN